LAGLWRRLEGPADLPGLHAAGHARRLQRRALVRAGARLVGAEPGREPAARALGRGGAERAARAGERRAQRAGAELRPARLLRVDRRPRRTRLSDRLPGRRRRLRRHVRRGPGGGVPRLFRRSPLPARDAPGARMARVMLRLAPWFSILALAVAW